MVTLDFETVKYIKESTSCVYGFQEKRKTFSLLERSRCADSFAAVPSSKTLTFSRLLLVHCCTVWPTSVLIILFLQEYEVSFETNVFFSKVDVNQLESLRSDPDAHSFSLQDTNSGFRVK